MTLISSSVSLPHRSFTLPLNCFQLPSTRFQSIAVTPFSWMTVNGWDKRMFRARQSARGLRFPAPRGKDVLGVAVRLLAALEDEIAGRLEGDAVEARGHRLVQGIAGILLVD